MDRFVGSDCSSVMINSSPMMKQYAFSPRLLWLGFLFASCLGLVAEEMPEAYKDVADVVDVVHRAGIGHIVARLKPMAVVKG